MDRRFFLAILLVAVIVLAVPRLLPTPERPKTPVPADTTAVARADADSLAAGGAGAAPALAAAGSTSIAAAPPGAPADSGTVAAPPLAADTVTVSTEAARFRLTTVGAELASVELPHYRSLRAGDGDVRLTRQHTPLLRYAVATGGDTARLDRVAFAVDSAPGTVTFTGALADGRAVTIRYAFAPDSYMVRVTGSVQGGAGGQLLLTFPNGMRSEEADTLDDIRHMAYVVKPIADDSRTIKFTDLDTARAQTETDGPYRWVASKNKYFVVGLLTDTTASGFTGLRVAPQLRAKKELATSASAMTALPLGGDGAFAFEIFAGPQQYERLNSVGRDFANVNPYGGWLGGIIQPFAKAVMKLLLWAHDVLAMNYGWVLILFGVAVRVLLWPLNQTAMRTQLKMQAIQPELQAIQKSVKDPQQQQQQIMALYKKHGMSPATPIMGCLPMLIPFPFLITLFYVFQNTIEFRGVPFLWLADISQKDPYYILPILMAVTMFIMSWIGIRSAPPNPQAKMLTYLMPVVMLVVFRNLAAGLNLYYAVQNLAAIPQQWLIAKERARAARP